MITLRHLDAGDTEWVKELHNAQALGYQLPDLDSEEIILKVGLENGLGLDPVLLLPRTAEAFLITGERPSGLAESRKLLSSILILDKEVPQAARELGLTDVYCNVPPDLERRFAKLLFRMGWKKNYWPMYCRQL